MGKSILKNGIIINDGSRFEGDILIQNGRIEKIAAEIGASSVDQVWDLKGKHIIPGVIDDQVHFREPGFPHKGNIATESKAAVAGGVTSYLEMPNTNPTTTHAQALQNKLDAASGRSWANYGFFFGATNHNLDEVLSIDTSKTCGIKIFMGSSTGDMLVDDPRVLEQIFSQCPLVIATHCEDEKTIRQNLEKARLEYGEEVPFRLHPQIRSREACLMSSSLAVELARKFGTQLHILHITTAEELALFGSGEMKGKNITSEVCVHHLWYSDADYEQKGGLIKCNPAIKTIQDQEALWRALNEDRIDIIASDHAPHSWEEKQQAYFSCPSGLPLVQHELNLMLHAASLGKISLEKLVRKMAHNPADRFEILERGYIREGYWADLVVVDPEAHFEVKGDDLQYHCHWSPLEGTQLQGTILKTIVNGSLVYDEGRFFQPAGSQLQYDR